jgi:multisubunit Na+/H+ antiporter MnhB subunit
VEPFEWWVKIFGGVITIGAGLVGALIGLVSVLKFSARFWRSSVPRGEVTQMTKIGFVVCLAFAVLATAQPAYTQEEPPKATPENRPTW